MHMSSSLKYDPFQGPLYHKDAVLYGLRGSRVYELSDL